LINLTNIEVIKGALTYTAEEMGIALRKSAYSPNIKERMDHSCALFDNKRRLIAQAEHIPVHLGSMALAVMEGLSKYQGELKSGDMILLNDPYLSGTHLPDLTLISPILISNQLIGYVANKAHHTDIGGKTPGSLAGDTTELCQEGLIIPPIKFVEDGEINTEFASILKRNVRTPKIQMGDLRAQIAANNTGVKRVKALVDRYGADKIIRSMEVIMDQSEIIMRKHIDAMPDGIYNASDWLENIGTREEKAKINVKITIEGDEIEFDYSGSSKQVEGPVNAPLGVTLAGIYYTLISITDPNLPVNDGCFRPIKLKIPRGSIINPRETAPVAGGNVETSQRNVDVLMLAFSKILPDRVPAAGLGTMNNISIGGNLENGESWTFYETIGGGSGGRSDSDGIDGIHVNMTNTLNTPIESLETYLPLRFDTYSLRPDSGGAGKYRGGCGIIRSWVLTSSKATLSILAERTKIPPWGLSGGRPGAMGEFILVRGDSKKEKIPSKCTITLFEGDKLIIKTPGGGGYGEPLERAPESILNDVINGLVSVKSAEEDYGVVIDEVNKVIDWKETKKRRQIS
jgi:N-methylhydantoinase B